MNPLEKSLIFITGTPRSGTSLMAKVIDSHPAIAILMENIFGNRRRHWIRADFWNSLTLLREEVWRVYSRFNEPIIGNKVVTPDVWDFEDIQVFCNLFKNYKVVFLVRDPRAVALSRYQREIDYSIVYTDKGRQNMMLNFESRFHAYISSWKHSIDIYWKLRETMMNQIKLIYYEDFCSDFEQQTHDIFNFLEIEFSQRVLDWYKYPHHDSMGRLTRNLKYRDVPVFKQIRTKYPKKISDILKSEQYNFQLWEKRKI
jgi:hypothetical protein